MELDREKVMDLETVLHRLSENIADLIKKCYSEKLKSPSANQMMRLLQDCRLGATELLNLGIGLPPANS